MTTFGLIHGAWGSGWHWSPLTAELERMGHEVIAPDLPIDDPEKTFDDYADVVLEALADAAEDVTLVGYSLGGLTAPLVAARRPVSRIVYLAAMIPEPGRSLLDQFGRGDRLLLPEYKEGLREPDEHGRTQWVDFDVYWRVSCHDCDEETARGRFDRLRSQATAAYEQPCSLITQPALPTTYIACREERLMNNEHWLPVARERLNVEPIEIDGSHTPMASRPAELAILLTGFEEG